MKQIVYERFLFPFIFFINSIFISFVLDCDKKEINNTKYRNIKKNRVEGKSLPEERLLAMARARNKRKRDKIEST